VLHKKSANQAIKTLDAGMKQLGVQRSYIGVQDNTLDATVRNLSTTHECLNAVRSRLKGTNMASESANSVRTQILQQASSAILSQTNSRHNMGISLFQA
jgi:flagellin